MLILHNTTFSFSYTSFYLFVCLSVFLLFLLHVHPFTLSNRLPFEIQMSAINITKTSRNSKHSRSKIIIASVVMLTGIYIYEVSLIKITTSVVDHSTYI